MKIKHQRKLKDLDSVRACEPPPFADHVKLTGMAAKGKAYERRLAAHLIRLVTEGKLTGDLWIGPWFKFSDANGPGLAQPDALLLQDDRVLIIEAKLKETKAAEPQITHYGELASHMFGVPWSGVQVYKWPSALRQNAFSLETLIDVEFEAGVIYNWCWL